MAGTRIRVVSGLTCPECGAQEMHPNGEVVLIRGFKVMSENGHWWSQCLVCAGYYDENLNYDNDAGNAEAGWF